METFEDEIDLLPVKEKRAIVKHFKIPVTANGKYKTTDMLTIDIMNKCDELNLSSLEELEKYTTDNTTSERGQQLQSLTIAELRAEAKRYGIRITFSTGSSRNYKTKTMLIEELSSDREPLSEEVFKTSPDELRSKLKAYGLSVYKNVNGSGRYKSKQEMIDTLKVFEATYKSDEERELYKKYNALSKDELSALKTERGIKANLTKKNLVDVLIR